MYEDLVKRLRTSQTLAEFVAEETAKMPNTIFGEAADAIEELLQKEKFHAFLWNVINPNDMQLYLEMYHSGNEKEDAG